MVDGQSTQPWNHKQRSYRKCPTGALFMVKGGSSRVIIERSSKELVWR